jgi:tryptophanyl-tRNA synthetase
MKLLYVHAFQPGRHYNAATLNVRTSFRRINTPTAIRTRTAITTMFTTTSTINNIPTKEEAEESTRTVITTSDNSSSNTTTSSSSNSVQSGNDSTTKTKPPKLRRILSGVQPTGTLHLGNYFGAIQQWVHFQNTHCPIDTVDSTTTTTTTTTDANDDDQSSTVAVQVLPPTTRVENFFCVVDLHAITSTTPQTPQELYQSSLMTVALYIAAGIDPQRSKIFIQSHVKAHSELAWILQCMTPINWIERMIQYKEKAKKMQETVSTGLMTYPILMAADILLYQATEVPVGEDQRQHLELTRDIVRRFHDVYNCTGSAYKKRMQQHRLSTYPVFIEPNAMIATSDIGTSRIMSLTDGTNKMSKSDVNDYSRINLLDSPDLIRDKIKRCKTDPIVGIVGGNVTRPEANNLLNIYVAVQPHRSRDDIVVEVCNMSWGTFKPLLAEAIIEHLLPIQTRYYDILQGGNNNNNSSSNQQVPTTKTTTTTTKTMMQIESPYLDQVLEDGARAANAIATQTLYKVKVAMGFVIPKVDVPSS